MALLPATVVRELQELVRASTEAAQEANRQKVNSATPEALVLSIKNELAIVITADMGPVNCADKNHSPLKASVTVDSAARTLVPGLPPTVQVCVQDSVAAFWQSAAATLSSSPTAHAALVVAIDKEMRFATVAGAERQRRVPKTTGANEPAVSFATGSKRAVAGPRRLVSISGPTPTAAPDAKLASHDQSRIPSPAVALAPSVSLPIVAPRAMLSAPCVINDVASFRALARSLPAANSSLSYIVTVSITTENQWLQFFQALAICSPSIVSLAVRSKVLPAAKNGREIKSLCNTMRAKGAPLLHHLHWDAPVMQQHRTANCPFTPHSAPALSSMIVEPSQFAKGDSKFAGLLRLTLLAPPPLGRSPSKFLRDAHGALTFAHLKACFSFAPATGFLRLLTPLSEMFPPASRQLTFVLKVLFMDQRRAAEWKSERLRDNTIAYFNAHRIPLVIVHTPTTDMIRFAATINNRLATHMKVVRAGRRVRCTLEEEDNARWIFEGVLSPSITNFVESLFFSRLRTLSLSTSQARSDLAALFGSSPSSLRELELLPTSAEDDSECSVLEWTAGSWHCPELQRICFALRLPNAMETSELRPMLPVYTSTVSARAILSFIRRHGIDCSQLVVVLKEVSFAEGWDKGYRMLKAVVHDVEDWQLKDNIIVRIEH